jgi:hypothetical protein
MDAAIGGRLDTVACELHDNAQAHRIIERSSQHPILRRLGDQNDDGQWPIN